MIGETWHKIKYGRETKAYPCRALLKNPPILVLDEATASVDVETEKCIQDALEQLIKGRTTLIIAHRLSTIRNADKIIFLENGKLIEQGNHFELVSLGGRYSKFCSHQENLISNRI